MVSSDSLDSLIGIDSLPRRFESLYACVSRLIRANLLNDNDIRNQLPALWLQAAFSPNAPLPEGILESLILRH